MLSYPIDEAEQLLSSKLSAAKHSLANCEEDMDFLREQITVGIEVLILQITDICQTMEVATARVYNWDVTMKRKEKTEQEAIDDKGESGTANG